MSQVSLRAEAGRASGSREARRIRRTGNVPAIVYGKGTDPVSVTVDAHDLQVALHTDAGSNALINLDIEGGDTLLTMARVIEKHPFRDEYRHIDFVTISIDEKLTVEVAIDFQGSPIGVLEGGVFSPRRTHVIVETLATAIPSSIGLDISNVEIGGSLRISDLAELEGVTYTEDPEAVIMSVTTPAAEIIEEPEEDLELAEGEELEEGEEGEGEADTGDEDEDTK
jgi:large subunit ribosomal protein L25